MYDGEVSIGSGDSWGLKGQADSRGSMSQTLGPAPISSGTYHVELTDVVSGESDETTFEITGGPEDDDPANNAGSANPSVRVSGSRSRGFTISVSGLTPEGDFWVHVRGGPDGQWAFHEFADGSGSARISLVPAPAENGVYGVGVTDVASGESARTSFVVSGR